MTQVVGSLGHEDVGSVGDEDWACLDHDGVVHILPRGERHMVSNCWCQPVAEIKPCGCVVKTHIAFDGRLSGETYKVVMQ